MISRQDITRLVSEGGLSIVDRSGNGKPIFVILICTCDECLKGYLGDE